jgi:predicted nuclease of predicted toxin-antitoxin system
LVPVTTKDHEIFRLARVTSAVVLTKDRDFVELVAQQGAPPQVVWVTCGNTSTSEMCRILDSTWAHAQRLLEQGEAVVD